MGTEFISLNLKYTTIVIYSLISKHFVVFLRQFQLTTMHMQLFPL